MNAVYLPANTKCSLLIYQSSGWECVHALLAGAVLMVCPPVPALLSLHQPDQDGSDEEQLDSESDEDLPVNLDETEDTRSANNQSSHYLPYPA